MLQIFYLQWAVYSEKLRQGESSYPTIQSVWKHIWKLKLRPKARFFLWCALKNVIPCRAILARQHVISSSVCIRCLRANDDLVHALWSCKFARWVWKCSPFCQLVGIQQVCSFMDLFSHVRTTFQDEDLCLFTVIAWTIWVERNKSLCGGVIRDPFAIYDKSLAFYKDFVDLCPSPKLPRHVASYFLLETSWG